MSDLRSGLEFPFEQPDAPNPPAVLDSDLLVVENLRLSAEVADLERKLERAKSTLQSLSGRLVELERDARHAADLEQALADMQADLVTAREADDALRATEARAVELEQALAEARAARHRAESELEALEHTRTLRYAKGARSAYTRLRHLAGRP